LHVYYYVPLHILCEIYSFFSHLTLSEIKIRTDWWINKKKWFALANMIPRPFLPGLSHGCCWDSIQGLDHGSFQIHCTTLYPRSMKWRRPSSIGMSYTSIYWRSLAIHRANIV
jgi:hypothetical protein